MHSTRTLKRLGSIGLVTGVLAAMAPFIGATAASATVGAIQLRDPCNNSNCAGSSQVSTQNNGTDSVVHLYAAAKQATGASPLLVTAVFLAHDDTTDPTDSQAPTVIATAPIKQFSAGPDVVGDDSYAVSTWTPASPGDTYTVTVNAIDANNATVNGSDAAQVITSNTAHSVRVTRPADDSLFGYYGTTTKFNVTGTATSTGDPVNAGDDQAVPSTPVTYDGTSQSWAADVPNSDGFTAPTAGHNVTIGFVDATNTTTNDYTITPGTAYLQAFDPNTGFKITPPNQFATKCAPASSCDDGATTLPATQADTSAHPIQNSGRKEYTIQTTDQHGNPISGLKFTLTFNDPNNDNSFQADKVVNNSGQRPTLTNLNATSGNAITATTDVFGRYQFTLSDSQNEQIGIVAQSEFNGTSFNAAVDFTQHATFTTAQQTATSGTATVVGHPTAPLYASQTYGAGAANGAGSTVAGMDAGPSPGILVNLKDANSQPIPGANVEYQYVRTIKSGTAPASDCPGGDTTTYPLSQGPFTSNNSDANGNLTIIPAALKCPHEAGSDAYTVYLEKNGTPGFQSGGDTLVGTVTLSFGPEQIFFVPCNQIASYEGGPTGNCHAQQKAGSDKTVQIYASIFDGTKLQPIASRKIDVSFTSTSGGTAGTDFGFSPNNNSGLTKVNNTQGDITTDANGNASVTLFDNSAGTLTVTASDPTLGSTSDEDGTDVISFRNYSAILNGTTPCGPGGPGCDSSVGQVTPISADSGAPVGAPGQPLVQGYQFTDQQGAALANEVITLTTDEGFFTDLPNGGKHDTSYTDLTFKTPIADGQPVTGDLHNLGKTITVVTDANGEGFFNLGILTDPHFALNGTAVGTVTGQLNATGSTQNLESTVLFATDSRNFPVAALNPGGMTLEQGRFDNNDRFQIQGGTPSGEKATANKNSIPVDEVDTIEIQKDSFGNLVSEPISVSSTGVGEDSPGVIYGAFTNVGNADESSDAVEHDVNVASNPAADNPSAGGQTVAFDWQAHHDVFQMNTTTGAQEVNTTTQHVDNGYQIQWYVRTAGSFHFATHFTPGAKEHAGTPITESVTVTDNQGRPVNDLGVEFIRSGPQGQTQDTGNPQTCTNQGCTEGLFTDVQGKAGFTFDSTAGGTYKVTVIITDKSGNELGRSVAHGELTGAKKVKVTIHTANGKTSFKKGSHHTLKGSAPANRDVKVYRGGKKIATVGANANGHWKLKLKFKKTHTYYAKSAGKKSHHLRIHVHK